MKKMNTTTAATATMNNSNNRKNTMKQLNGYDVQMQQLKAQGLHYPRLSLCLLHKFNGDVDKVAARLNKRECRKGGITQMNFSNQAALSAASTSTEAQLKQFQAECPYLTARLLEKFNGDAEKVVLRIRKRKLKAHSNKCLPETQSTPIVRQWAAEIKQLQDQGLDFPMVAHRLLSKFDGDVDKVASVLNKHRRRWEKRNTKMAARLAKEQQWEAEIKQLQDQGLDFPMVAHRLLNKFDGDVDMVASVLNKHRRRWEKRNTKMAARLAKEQNNAPQWEAEIKQLQDQGLDFPMVAHRLLNKFDGDVDMVASVLNKHLCRREKRNTKMAARLAKKQNNAPQWEAEIKQLQDQGLDFPFAAKRLLNKFDGDVDKVASVLKKHQPQLEKRKAKIAARQARNILTPATPVVSKTPEKELCPADSVDDSRWGAEIKQLQDQGLDFPIVSRRLLSKFDGDVDKVAAVLTKHKTKFEARKAKFQAKQEWKKQKQQRRQQWKQEKRQLKRQEKQQRQQQTRENKEEAKGVPEEILQQQSTESTDVQHQLTIDERLTALEHRVTSLLSVLEKNEL